LPVINARVECGCSGLDAFCEFVFVIDDAGKVGSGGRPTDVPDLRRGVQITTSVLSK